MYTIDDIFCMNRMIDRAEINRTELKLPCQSSTLPWIPQA